MHESWEREIVVYAHHVPELGEMVNLTNKNNYSQPFKVTGLRSWVTRWWLRRKEHIKIYVDNAQMELSL